MTQPKQDTEKSYLKPNKPGSTAGLVRINGKLQYPEFLAWRASRKAP